MSTTSMAIFPNPLFATYSVYARNASIPHIVALTLLTEWELATASLAPAVARGSLGDLGT